ncbi:MAG: hypothetical protein Ta2B_20980 [Termitinemataceae bacterium]|nr:MAG: hypothetical protein Ta2B_20980 [Termitinemataceae bacterium]
MKIYRKWLVFFSISCTSVFFSCYMVNTPQVPNMVGFHDISGYYDAGENWHGGESPFSSPVTGIASSGKMSAAVNHDNIIAYSDDAKIWRIVSAYSGAVFHSVQYNSVTWGALPAKEAKSSPSGGVFLAGGDGGKVAYSYDGIMWTRGVIGPMSPIDINGVAVGIMYDEPVFAAVGNDGRICYAIGSVTGTWKEASHTPFGDVEGSGEDVFDVCFGTIKDQGMFAAVGENGKFAYMRDFSGTWYGTKTGTGFNLNSVCYGDDRFVAVGNSGIIKFTDNPHESVWSTSDSVVFGPRAFNTIRYDKCIGQYVLVGADSVVGYSENGISWTAATFKELFEEGISAIGCTDTRIIMGSKNGNIIYSN